MLLKSPRPCMITAGDACHVGYCYLILLVMCLRYLLYYKRESLPGELHLLLSLHNKPSSVIPFWNPYTNGYGVMEPDFPFSGSYPGNGRFSVCSKGCTSRSTLFSPSFHSGQSRVLDLLLLIKRGGLFQLGDRTPRLPQAL